MAPALTIPQNQRDVTLSDAKSLGYFGLAHGASETSDFSDFLGAQEFLEPGYPTNIDRVLFVSGIVSPFEIGSHAVAFDAVKVIDDGQAIRVRNEGESNQPVNVDRFAFAVSEKIDVSVSEFVRTWPQDFSVNVPSLQSVAYSIKAADATEVTDFVKFTEFGDGDTPPFFDEHNMVPFARSRHVIASFCAHQGD